MTVVCPYPQNLMDGAHPQSVLSKLNEQRSQGLFCDVTIVVEDVKFRAHRNILAACSGYFRNALTSPGALTSSQVLELLDLKSEVFASILNFIYCSKVISPCAEDKGGLVAAGKRLGIHFLEKLVEQERQEEGIKSKDPSTDPLSKITKKETPRPEEIETDKGPRITNAFSITEVCHGNNLFTPLIQTNGERQSPDVGQLPPSCSTTSSLSGSNESSQALSEHSYAVVQPTAGKDNSHWDNKRVCKPGMSQPKQLLYRNAGPLKKRPRLTGSVGKDLRPELAKPHTDKLNAILPTSPDNVSAAPSALRTPPTLSSEDETERIMDSGRALAPNDVLMGLGPPVLSPHTQDGVAVHGCERCPEVFTNKAVVSCHSEVHKNRFVSHLFCKFCHRKFMHLKRLRNHEHICLKAARDPSKSDATDMSTKQIHLHLTDMTKNKEKSMTQLPAADLYTSYAPERLQVEQPEPLQAQTVRPAGSQRRYSCSVCKRVYVTLSSLKRHENVHSWQRAYPCHYCNKVFALAEYRTKHEIWHTGDRRYQCIFCLKAFMTYYILKNHQKSSHGIDPSLAVRKKAANGGLNANSYPIKLYRLLPMKFRKRQYKTYSQTYSENLVGADQASQDSCSLIPPSQQNGPIGQSESVTFQRTFMATTKTVASVMPHISFDHPCDQDVDQSLNSKVDNPRGRRKDSESRDSSFMNNTGQESPAATFRDDPPLPSNAEHRGHDVSFMNPLNTFKKLGELSASAKRVEEMTKEILQYSTENLLQNKMKEAKTETYIAKPACPGPSVGGAASPVCQITVKIGNEAIIRRQIKGSKLFPRRKKRIREVSGEETQSQCPPERENSESPRLRFRSEATAITEPEPFGGPGECDTADLLWRPYYSYKAKKKRKRFKHRKATFQHYPETSADRTTRISEGDRLTDGSVQGSCGEVKRNQSRNSSPRATYICEICDSSFITETGLRAHVIGSHPFFCRTCGKQGPPGEAPGGGDYICSNCMENGSCFDKTPRSPNTEKKYRCSFCPQRFLYLATKKSHEKKHQETRVEGYELMPGSQSSAHLNEHPNQHQNQDTIRTEERSNPGGPTIKRERLEEGHFSIDRIQPQREDMMSYSDIKTPCSPGTDPLPVSSGTDPFLSSADTDPFLSSPGTDPFLSLTPLKGKYKMLEKRHKVQHSMHLL